MRLINQLGEKQKNTTTNTHAHSLTDSHVSDCDIGGRNCGPVMWGSHQQRARTVENDDDDAMMMVDDPAGVRGVVRRGKEM